MLNDGVIARAMPSMRRMVWVAAVLIAACGDDDSGSSPGNDGGAGGPSSVACGVVGRSTACTGPGGCQGAQVCQADGSFSDCDCGSGTAGRGAGGASGSTAPVMCGAACTANSDCGSGFCVEPNPGSIDVEGLGMLSLDLFPGGMCSAAPLVEFNRPEACDPSVAPSAQGCGSCGICTPVFFSNAVATVCRERCEPSADDNGCSRPEYTCDFEIGACVEGCQSDDECRVRARDMDGDGAPDVYEYDATSAAICSPMTSRCTVTGTAGAKAGDACIHDDDCEADGECLYEGGPSYFEVPFRDGYCTKNGCQVAGLECAGGGVCTELRSWDPTQLLGTLCMQPCMQGTEAAASQLGATGHGEGCREGYACLWSGTASDPAGTCVPGNYNAVTVNNVGDLCEMQADCFSPFGHGRCTVMGNAQAQASFCTIFDCMAPGLPADVCGEGNTCQQIDDERTGCFRSCEDASACAAGLACVRLGTQTTGICIFGCAADSECRTGETCAPTGECAAG